LSTTCSTDKKTMEIGNMSIKPKPVEKAVELPKPVSAPKKEAPPEKTGGVDGFLIPEFYRRQSVYKNNPIFRGTLLAILLTLLVGVAGGYRWLEANKLKKTVDATAKTGVAEATRLQNQALLLKTTRERFREVEGLRKQLRIPITPILDGIEKTIPNDISINSITMVCPPFAAAKNQKRKATVTAVVFFPEGIEPTDPEKTGGWVETLTRRLGENGLIARSGEWGAQRQFEQRKTKEMIRKKEVGVKGWTRELTFTVELENQ
jgi:hypothetical protein